MKKVKAIIERAGDGMFSVYFDDASLDYLNTGSGTTEEEAKADFLEAYEAIKESYKKQGRHFEEVEFEFTTDTVSYLKYYASFFSLVGLSKIIGINKGQLSHYINGTSKPSRRTETKIKDNIYNFGKDITVAMSI